MDKQDKQETDKPTRSHSYFKPMKQEGEVGGGFDWTVGFTGLSLFLCLLQLLLYMNQLVH